MSPTQQDELQAWVVSDLWEATGRVYGTCPVSVLPCNDFTLCGSCNRSYRRCGCYSVSEVKLPGPVASVTAVIVAGEELPTDAYRIDDYQWLVRLDGGTWPTNADPIDPDGFRVDYDQGILPPAGAGIVAGILLCSRSNCGNKSCRVPRRVREVSRQGVTMIWSEEGFGIPDVDDWVRNANSPIRAGSVYSPDLPYVRQITWEAAASP